MKPLWLETLKVAGGGQRCKVNMAQVALVAPNRGNRGCSLDLAALALNYDERHFDVPDTIDELATLLVPRGWKALTNMAGTKILVNMDHIACVRERPSFRSLLLADATNVEDGYVDVRESYDEITAP